VDTLETLDTERLDEQVDRLAHHALRGEVWDKAVTYCQQAGVSAYNHAAFGEAVASFEQALAALTHVPESPTQTALAIDLHLNLSVSSEQLGENERSLVLIGEAEALARTLDDRARLGRVLVQKTQLLRTIADHPGAIVTGQQALAITADLGDRAMQVAATHRLAQLSFAIGDFSQAAILLQQNVAALEAGTPDPRRGYGIQSRAWLALVMGFLGEFAKGRPYGEEAFRLASGEGRRDTPGGAYGCLGLLFLTKGDLEHAIWVLDQGLALCRAIDNRGWARWIAAGLDHAYALTGHITEGLALLEDALREDIHTGAMHGHSEHVARLSEVCLLAGRHDEAWQYACQALDLARQYRERGFEALALRQLGAVHAHAASLDVEPAETFYLQALAEELGMRPLQAHCYRGLGTLYAKIGRREQACTALSTAIELYRTMEMIFWLPQAEAVLAQVT
jgi:tetratricopeptide (TPR) repeat protein